MELRTLFTAPRLLVVAGFLATLAFSTVSSAARTHPAARVWRRNSDCAALKATLRSRQLEEQSATAPKPATIAETTNPFPPFQYPPPPGTPSPPPPSSRPPPPASPISQTRSSSSQPPLSVSTHSPVNSPQPSPVRRAFHNSHAVAAAIGGALALIVVAIVLLAVCKGPKDHDSSWK